MDSKPRYDVLVVGGTGIDTIVRVDALPVPLVDSMPVPPITDFVAHTGNGYALGLHSLGLATKFIDFLGEDAQGAAVLAEYDRRGLDFSYQASPSGTPRAVNLVDATGRRMSFFDSRHPAELRLPGDFYRPFLAETRHVHLSITNVNRDMYADIIDAEIPNSTDLHDWDGRNPYHLDYARNADVVFLSAAALGERRDTVIREIADAGRAHLVVATDGANGCYALNAGRGGVRHFPAVRPDVDLARLPAWQGWSCVDSNGAGDAFASGFLAAYLAGYTLATAVTAGSVAGAFACRSAGTHTEFIDADTLRQAMDRLAP